MAEAWAFRVAPDVYDGELANLMLGFLRLALPGIDIAFERHGVAFGRTTKVTWKTACSTTSTAKWRAARRTGGWYDAGDYGNTCRPPPKPGHDAGPPGSLLGALQHLQPAFHSRARQ